MSGHRILYILPQPYLLNRGSSFRAKSTLDALAELGYVVDVLCYPMGNTPSRMRYTIRRCPRFPGVSSVKVGPSPQKILQDIPLWLQAKALMRKHRYALVHGVEEAGFMAYWLGRRHHIPFIYDMHSWMSQQIEGTKFGRWRLALRQFKKLERKAMNHASAIVTVGPEMSRILATLAPGVPAVTLLDCPMDFDPPPTAAEQEAVRSRFFPPGKKTILYTGNFHPYQGIDLLLESVRTLQTRAAGRYDFSLLLVGGGAGEAQAAQDYRAKAEALGIQSRVVFCGEQPAHLIPVFMAHADVLVSSRISGNNVPLKIYSYLASGTLLVATRIPSHTQVLNEENCLLAEPDPEALAAALDHGLSGMGEVEKARILAGATRFSAAEQRQEFKRILGECYARCLSRPVS